MTQKCECPNKGVLYSHISFLYDEETELPFVEHEPGECKCTNELEQYKCDDGVTRFLCSCCR